MTEIPVYSSLKTTLNRVRRKSLGNALDPKLREDIIIPFDSEFVLLNDGEENRIIGLCSIKCRQYAFEGKAYFVEGTFKSCSKQIYQINTKHIDIGSTNEEINIIPVIYIYYFRIKQKWFTNVYFR